MDQWARERSPRRDYRAQYGRDQSRFSVVLSTVEEELGFAARAAARTRPTGALPEATPQRRGLNWFRAVFAVLCPAGGTATPAAMLWAAGFGLPGPVLTRPAGAVLPVMLATGMAGHRPDLPADDPEPGAQQACEENLRADLVLTSPTGGVPVSLAAGLRPSAELRLPGAVQGRTGGVRRQGPQTEGHPRADHRSVRDRGPVPVRLPLRGRAAGGVPLFASGAPDRFDRVRGEHEADAPHTAVTSTAAGTTSWSSAASGGHPVRGSAAARLRQVPVPGVAGGHGRPPAAGQVSGVRGGGWRRGRCRSGRVGRWSCTGRTSRGRRRPRPGTRRDRPGGRSRPGVRRPR